MKPENNPLLDFQSPITQLNNIFPNNNANSDSKPFNNESSNIKKEDESSERFSKELVYANEPQRTKFCGIPLKRRVPARMLPERMVYANVPDDAVPSNKISTSKYNVVTFLPMNLFEQFSKAANLYFLLIGALQVIEEISNTNGQPLQYIPLFFIVLVSMFKDLFEDLKRHKSDYEENNKKTLLLNKDGNFVSTAWKNLKIGHIVKVEENQYLPADLLILKTSDPKGVCFIETKNLDGETNLKYKMMNKDLGFEFNPENIKDDKEILIRFERPNPLLYDFNGSALTSNNKFIGFNHQNFILRGCSLRNTKWIIGFVAYTGHDSKIMLNSTKARPKKSQVDKQMNRQIVFVFISLLLISLFAAIYAAIWLSYKETDLPYLEIQTNDSESSSQIYILVSYGTWILLLANFVPISLIVTLEAVKFMQAMIISKDNLLCTEKDKIHATVQSSNLNEELGQINYIFSDKTGTLTCNIMDFKKFCVGGISYGENYNEELSKNEIEEKPLVSNVDFKDKSFFCCLDQKKGEEAERARESLIFLACCHSVLAEIKNGDTVYNAASPDELALINFAKFSGYEYKGTNESNFIEVEINKEEIKKYKFLHSLEFNSTRKRHSVIVEDEQGKIIIFCKGADTIIYDRINNKNTPIADKTWKYLAEYANIGLRTLVLARKFIEKTEFEDWNRKYKQALGSMVDREVKLAALQDEIESNMTLLAATAIEDKLQDEVGETISILKQAGIQLWVLTGDKIETAINIGYSCKLLNDDLHQVEIEGNNVFEVQESIKNVFKIIANKTAENYAMIVSGSALNHSLNSTEIKKDLMNIADYCSVVLACRVSPKQKQEIVSLVRDQKPHSITLAIGDGANDVNMITAAHVGVGIKGLEGQQAARASDYSIGEFKFLRRLVLYYGRESYRKNSTLICFNFYKNILLVMPIFWFGFWDGFSGQLIYDPWIFQFFNVFYASVPIILYALFDEEFPISKYLSITNKKNKYDAQREDTPNEKQELSCGKTKKEEKNKLEIEPKWYELGREGKLFNAKVFWAWMGNGFAHSIIVLFFCYASVDVSQLNYGGQTGYMYASGMMAFTVVVFLSNLKLIIFSKSFLNLTSLTIILSIGFYIANFFVFNLFTLLDCFSDFSTLHRSSYFYLGCFLICGYTIGTDLIFVKFLNFNKICEHKKSQILPIDSPTERPLEIKLKGYPENQITNANPLNLGNHSENQITNANPLNLAQNSSLGRSTSRRYTGFGFDKDEQKADWIIKNYH